jgi:hypothetical protein
MPPVRRAMAFVPRTVVRLLAAAMRRDVESMKPGELVIHARKK